LLSFFPIKNVLNKIIRFYHVIVITLINVALISNSVIYHYWNTLLNWRALDYLNDPIGVFASVSPYQLIFLIVCLVILIIFSVKIFFKFVYREPDYSSINTVTRIVLTILLPAFLFLAIRGGWGVAPINESAAYFSTVKQINDAATNSLWHLGHSISTAKQNHNPFVSIPQREAEELVSSLYVTQQDSSKRILSVNRPNVVIFLLESFSADLLGCMGAEVSATPFIDSLSEKGVLFTAVYSSGFRTDQGMAAVLSGFPATPLYTIVRFPEKADKLPSLPEIFRKNAYHTSFYYGGESNFRNIRSYCYNSGIERVNDLNDFEAGLPKSEWGVHDEFVLLRQAKDLSQEQQPFFSVLLTLSNHEPYDVPPTRSTFGKDDEADRMRNSAYYTDQSLKKYFDDASHQPWFNNTLFIIVADHGHYLPAHRQLETPEAHHVPLLFFGNVIKPEWRGKRVDMLGNHHDIAATLSVQLNFDHSGFNWSKDLLNPSSHGFAYYQMEDGFGWITKKQWMYYSTLQKRISAKADIFFIDSNEVKQGSAYLQKLYDQYLRY
jgi:phosphoglycerol transferase MdoB-like AlkP superfamily enzyme